MERCDFSSVMTIVRRFISDDYNTNQTELLGDVFSSFFNRPDDPGAFDMALVCRWFTGQAKVSPKISQFYSKVGNREKLAEDLEDGILPLMYDSAMAAQELYRLLVQDDTISERVKKECSRYYPLPVAFSRTQKNTRVSWSKSLIRFTATLWRWNWQHDCLKRGFWNRWLCWKS